MNTNIFELSTEQLREIANKLQEKIEEGLKKEGKEILAIPTHIYPGATIENGKVMALDWGGSNFRASIVEFKNGKPTVLEQKKKKLDAVVTVGFKPEDLHREMAATISQLEALDKTVTQIGYCFSYPAASRLNGDAVLLRWAKRIDIKEMIEQPVGELLLNYLNNYFKKDGIEFKNIKVINDTVACLFAGLSETGYDSYIGLIVGTGTNMAGLMRLDKIEKLNNKETRLIPINLESGNFSPPHLTVIDALVDAISNNKGIQRFEKAVSGGYLGEVFKTFFPYEKIRYDFDAEHLENLIFRRKGYEEAPEEQVQVARWICNRSAQLVAASLAGLAQVIAAQEPKVKRICLAADGSVFWGWGKNETGEPYYKALVASELEKLLPAGVSVNIIPEMKDPNLIGSAIAALS